MNAEAGAGLARKCLEPSSCALPRLVRKPECRRPPACRRGRRQAGLPTRPPQGPDVRPRQGRAAVQIIGRHPGTASQVAMASLPGAITRLSSGRSGNGPCQRMFASAAADRRIFMDTVPLGCAGNACARGGPKPFARTAIWHKNGGSEEEVRPCQPIFCPDLPPDCRLGSASAEAGSNAAISQHHRALAAAETHGREQF